MHYQGDIFYLTPNAGTDSNDDITIKNYATSNGAPNIILKTSNISGAYGISVGTLSLIGGSKTTHYGVGGKIVLQSGQGRNAANNPSGYAPISLQSNGGNVGIGTSSPGQELEIYSSTPMLRLRDSGYTGSSTTAYVEFGGTDAATWNRTGYVGDGSSGNTDISLQAIFGDLHLGDSSGINVLNLKGGNVGIGTTTPNVKLDVQGGHTNLSGDLIVGSNFTVDTDLIFTNNALDRIGINTVNPFVVTPSYTYGSTVGGLHLESSGGARFIIKGGTS